MERRGYSGGKRERELLLIYDNQVKGELLTLLKDGDGNENRRRREHNVLVAV